MTERENLPVVIAAHAVTVLKEQRGSLVRRGLEAVRISKHPTQSNDNDALYRQARAVFDRFDAKYHWSEHECPPLFLAFKTFQHLSDKNYGKTYYPLSVLYDCNDDFDANKTRQEYFAQMAFDWCFANQVNQDVELWCDLGCMYRLGMGVEKSDESDEKATYWFHKAAEQGYAPAQSRLGFQYYYGSGVEKSKKLAEYWYCKAAEQGNAVLQLLLGCKYRDGKYVAQNDEQVVYWFRNAAKQGNFSAQLKLGDMYREGCGVEKNVEQAMYWFRKAAEKGSPQGEWMVGEMYSKGQGVKQSDAEAAKWYRLAAKQGYDKYQYNLGMMCANGQGAPQDYKEAVKWYRLAAEQGHPDAQEALRKLSVDWEK